MANEVEAIVDRRVVSEANADQMEAIVDRRKAQKVTQYLVKWKGLGPELNSWVPQHDLPPSADTMVLEFREAWQAEINAQRMRLLGHTSQPTAIKTEIEAIVDRRRRQTVTQYLVKWKSHDTSWVPADQLPKGSTSFVQAYEHTWQAEIANQRQCLPSPLKWRSSL